SRGGPSPRTGPRTPTRRRAWHPSAPRREAVPVAPVAPAVPVGPVGPEAVRGKDITAVTIGVVTARPGRTPKTARALPPWTGPTPGPGTTGPRTVTAVDPTTNPHA